MELKKIQQSGSFFKGLNMEIKMSEDERRNLTKDHQ